MFSRCLHAVLTAAGAEALGFIVPPKPHRSPHIVGLKPGEGMPSTEELVRGLKQRSRPVLVSDRMGYIRVSPHVYNDERDAEELLEALAQALGAVGGAGGRAGGSRL